MLSGRDPVGIARVLLTLTALEFFGPIVRDSGVSHLMNPFWDGHARVHLVWLMGFMGTSGLVNLYLLWLRRPRDVRDVHLAAALQCCNLAGFWIAFFLCPLYVGVIAVPGIHVKIFGWDENVFGFSIFTAMIGAAIALLIRARRGQA
ncbi:MAG: hypothetical protein U0610_15095 [bacterium]